MTMTIRERVELGARFLDETMPDWRHMVSVDFLDMGSLESCVLGQTHGFTAGGIELCEWFDFGDDNPQLIVALEAAGFEKSDDITYRDLQAEWLRVIANEPECDGCDQDPWREPVHYGTCPLNINNNNLIGRTA